MNGLQCPHCGLFFAVIASADGKTFKTIPCDGSVDYFCPACGNNLREAILKAK